MSNEALRYIPFTRSDITDEDIQQAAGIIRDSDKDTSKLIRGCEQNFAGMTNFPYTIAVNTALQAFLLSLRSLGIQESDEVIMPSYAGPDIGEAVEHSGASAVFADIDRQSLILSTESVTAGIGHKTKAIVVCDTAGFAADVKPILELAAANGVYVIHYTHYNPLHEYRNKTAGTYPQITIFSNNDPFTKGAIIATDMEKTQSSIKSLREHGIKASKNSNEPIPHSNWYYEITSPGFDCMMTGIQCALFSVYLKKTGHSTELRRQRAGIYDSLLQPFQDRVLLPVFAASDTSHTWQSYTIRIMKDSILLNRDEFIHELKQRGVEASVPYIPLHIHPYYSKKYKYTYNILPNTYDIYTSDVSLPLYSQLSDDDAYYVAQTVIDVVKRYAR